MDSANKPRELVVCYLVFVLEQDVNKIFYGLPD